MSHSRLTRLHSTKGFTLVEAMVSMALGSSVILIAFTGFRVTAQTISAVNRLSTQNQVMRAGFAYALEEIDYWILYDDPTAIDLDVNDDQFPAGQGLRRYGDVQFTRSGGYAPVRRYGLPFTALKVIPVDNEFTPSPDTWTTRKDEPELSLDMQYTNDAELFRLDQDRGFDPRRPYQANNPTAWYRGSATDTLDGQRREGRYGLFSNISRKPLLGFGNNNQNFVSWNGISFQGAIKTGAYGPYAPMTYGNINDAQLPSRTFTWSSNQIIFLWESIGTAGLLEYMPSNTLIGAYGSWLDMAAMPSGWASDPTMPIPNADNWARLGEQRDRRLAARILGSDATPTSILGISINTLHPISPGTGYSGSYNNGYASDSDEGFAEGDDFRKSDSLLSIQQLIGHQRETRWEGPNAHMWAVIRTLARNVMAVPLLPQRPEGWPDMRLAVQRGILQGRIHAITRVRWIDQATGQATELPVVSMGTSLRGARQQRNPNGGWARWNGPTDHPRFGPLIHLLHPSLTADGDALDANNDPNLDSQP